jgi:hypothetical protein
VVRENGVRGALGGYQRGTWGPVAVRAHVRRVQSTRESARLLALHGIAQIRVARGLADAVVHIRQELVEREDGVLLKLACRHRGLGWHSNSVSVLNY